MSYQMKFGSDGKLQERQEPKFKLGDFVRLKHPMGLEGTFVIDGVWQEWGAPLYTILRKEGKNTYMGCCTEEGLIRV